MEVKRKLSKQINTHISVKTHTQTNQGNIKKPKQGVEFCDNFRPRIAGINNGLYSGLHRKKRMRCLHDYRRLSRQVKSIHLPNVCRETPDQVAN